MKFQDQLRKYTQIAFDNEKDLLNKFADDSLNDESLNCFYMSGSLCIIKTIKSLSHCNRTYEYTITTDDYIAWADSLEDKE
jgi:hypothetical protein